MWNIRLMQILRAHMKFCGKSARPCSGSILGFGSPGLALFIRSQRQPHQWRIYIQKFLARPPNRTKFFRFYICFHQKAPVSEVGAPSNEGWHPPNGKSWIRPCTSKRKKCGLRAAVPSERRCSFLVIF